jgi:hypothetical protein
VERGGGERRRRAKVESGGGERLARSCVRGLAKWGDHGGMCRWGIGRASVRVGAHSTKR